MPRRYLVLRTDRTQRAFLTRELEQGRLRQGFGWRREHDLRLLRDQVRAGKKLTEEEASVWRNRRLLDTEPDGLKPGNVLILPNLLDQGRWALARVKGAYEYAPIVAPGREGPDYGHIIAVDPIRTPAGKVASVEAENTHVDAELRATMRNPSRMWSIDALGSTVEALVHAIESGKDTWTPDPETQKAEGFFTAVRDAAWKHILTKYKGNELAHLVHHLFMCIYEGGRVEHWGGAGERGTDLIVYTRDPLGLEYKVAVQIKQNDGLHDDERTLSQIEQAKELHKIDAGVIVTTAEVTSNGFEEKCAALEGRLGIDIRVIARGELIELVMKYLGKARMTVREALIDLLRGSTPTPEPREHTAVTDRIYDELQRLPELERQIAGTKVAHQNRGSGIHLIRVELPQEMIGAVVEPIAQSIVSCLRRMVPSAKCQRGKPGGSGTKWMVVDTLLELA
ncbi:restriction endonuclease [Polyangium sorediatum]|uniref:Restriction endonuclease n=1 Tax=Polyangium sorediatum TaxID=889274 RepID=A0ABT6P770_9BACT|nr:restriction endonuclease [Polyangium sorediatum]MDI1436469.1 restriction endonuclease [Polyangium sorediatum]